MPSQERAPGKVHATRALALAAFLLAPALSGCLSRASQSACEPPVAPEEVDLCAREVVKIEEPPLGDFVPEKPAAPSAPTRPPASETGPDPRLNLTKSWGRGDTWYYESNRTNWMKVRVLGLIQVNGTPHYLLRTQYGKIGESAIAVIDQAISREFEIVNQTTPATHERYYPPKPGPRFLPRDGTYSFNSTQLVRRTGELVRHVNSVHVVEEWPLYPVRVPAGTFNASYFSVFNARVPILENGRFGELERFATERWYSPDLLNDVMLRTGVGTETEEDFQLVYARVYGRFHGFSVEYEK